MNNIRISILAVICSVFMVPAAYAGTLDTVKSQGFFNCGVSQGVPGFSNPDESGNWSGIDVDVCRAVSAAVFGNRVPVSGFSLKVYIGGLLNST